MISFACQCSPLLYRPLHAPGSSGGYFYMSKSASSTSKKIGTTVKKPADPARKSAPDKLKRKDYDKALKHLHIELVKLQQWVVAKGIKICIVFEGRDGAGKGGTIKAITERVSPRVFRVA